MTQHKWPSVRRTNSIVPWGYTEDPTNPRMMDPIQDHLDAFEQAKEYIKQGCSYRDTAKWLTATTECRMSHVGLHKRINQAIKKKRSKAAKKAWQTRYGEQADNSTPT